MGRSNGKLVPFLKHSLEMNRFINLKYEDEEVFYIELPRYEKSKCGEHEIILKAWYDYTGKIHKYENYSTAKSVIQAALKKSIYLISLPSIGKRMRFRFATSEEIKGRQIKEKKKDPQHASPSNPPSVSSGYRSGSEESGLEYMQISEMKDEKKNDPQHASPSNPPSVSSGYQSGSEECELECNQISEMKDDFLDTVFTNPEKYINNCDDLDDIFNGFDLDANENSPALNIQINDIKENLEDIVMPVIELKTIPVAVPLSVKKYWLCTQKIKVKSTLQLICELKTIESGNTGIKEGSVVFPNGVFEPGILYDLKKSFELGEMYFFFFEPNSV